MVDLGDKVVPAQGDTEQKLNTGHDGVACRIADITVGQLHLEAAYIICRRGIRQATEPDGKSTAAADMRA